MTCDECRKATDQHLWIIRFPDGVEIDFCCITCLHKWAERSDPYPKLVWR